MQSASEAPSTSQENTKAISSGGNSVAEKKNDTLNLHFLGALNSIPPWGKLVLGSVVLLAIPFCRKILKIQDLRKTIETAVEAVETAAEAAEKLVEAAEKVAEAAEKVVEEVVEVLPNGRLKEAVVKLEQIAAFIDEKAEAVDSLIDKVDDVVDELEMKLKSNTKGGEQKNE